MSEIFQNEADVSQLKENKIIFSNTEFINTQITFDGVNNYIFIQPGSVFDNVKIQISGSNNFLYISRSARISLDITVFNNSVIYIGSENYYNGPLSIFCAEESNIFIGSNSLFSTNVYIVTSDGHLLYSLNRGFRLNQAEDIYIGNQVWICDDVKISKGAEIYSNVVIGTKSFAGTGICYSNSVYAGSPVRKVRSNICWRGNCTYAYQAPDFDKWCIIRQPSFRVPEHGVSFDFIRQRFNELKGNHTKLLDYLNSPEFQKQSADLYADGRTADLSSVKRIYALNTAQWKKLFNNRFINSAALSVSEQTDGFILPPKCLSKQKGNYAGGVADASKKLIAGFRRHHARQYYYSCESSYSFDPVSCVSVNETVIFGGILVNHFGHFMLEGFSRLWYLINHPALIYRYRVAFGVINGVASWFNAFLELAGIPAQRVLFVDKVTRFSKIIIPDESIMSWDYIHPEYFIPYEKMISEARKKHAGREAFPKIYLSKSSYSAGCRCIGEEYFENFYRTKGFKVIYPEKRSIGEMIYLMSCAKEVVTTMGTLSHYFLFAGEGTRCVALTRTHDDTLYPQALINTVKNLDWYIVDVSQNFFYAIRVAGISLLGITQSWKDFVRDRYDEEITGETDSRYIFEYLKSFYQMYKDPAMFKNINSMGMTDVFKRLGMLFFGESFSYEDKAVKTDYQINADCCKYRLDLLKAHPDLADVIDSRAVLKYSGHISGIGDSPFVIENAELGSPSKGNQIEGLIIDFASGQADLRLKYAVLSSNNRWTAMMDAGSFAGTRGRSQPVTGIQACLYSPDDARTESSGVRAGKLTYALEYRIFSSGVWSCWAVNGEKLVSPDNRPIFAIQMRLISNL